MYWILSSGYREDLSGSFLTGLDANRIERQMDWAPTGLKSIALNANGTKY